MSWIYSLIGIIFCATAVFLFYKNVFEEQGKISNAVLLMILGVVLIAIGAAKDLRLME